MENIEQREGARETSVCVCWGGGGVVWRKVKEKENKYEDETCVWLYVEESKRKGKIRRWGRSERAGEKKERKKEEEFLGLGKATLEENIGTKNIDYFTIYFFFTIVMLKSMWWWRKNCEYMYKWKTITHSLPCQRRGKEVVK